MNKHSIVKAGRLLTLMLSLVFVCGLSGCKEDIDMSNRYTFTDETIISYLEKNPQFSEYVNLLGIEKVSNKSNSTLSQLLGARGNFTCFAPSNKAIGKYLDSLYKKEIISSPSWDGFPNQACKDSIVKVIVRNSIIDGGDLTVFDISSLPENNEEINVPNLYDNSLTVQRRPDFPDSILISGAVISLSNRDFEAINGRVHEMDDVIAPSNATIGELLNAGKDHKFMAKLIEATGWADTITKTKEDVSWFEAYENGDIKDLPNHPSQGEAGTLPEKRKIGFTLFLEKDQVYEDLLGRTAAELTPADLRDYLVANYSADFPGTTHNDDFKNKNNILNQFVSYHMLPMRISYDQLVIHYNEKGFNYQTMQTPTIPVMEYYETMGSPRRLLKIYESQESNGIYLNRFPQLRNNTRDFAVNDYHEASVPTGEKAGILVNSAASDGSTENNVSINGVIYPIDNLLIYTQNTRTSLQNERMRFDFAALLPELMTNKIRRPMTPYTQGSSANRGFPTNRQYFNNMILQEGTTCYYLTGLGKGWNSFQGDEINVAGRYDLTIKMPPVPKDGVYEIRIGVNSHSQDRGMAQVYWGSDKDALPAMGIPLDFRMGGLQRVTKAGTFPSIVGWEKDTDDENYNADVDKRMRNNDFMKAPEYFSGSPGSSTTVRADDRILRRVVVRHDMKANETYWIRFKSVLDNEKLEMVLDYVELCAKEVYDNPLDSEDKW